MKKSSLIEKVVNKNYKKTEENFENDRWYEGSSRSKGPLRQN